MTAPRLLLLPGPGLHAALLDEFLRDHGLRRLADQPRGHEQQRFLRWALGAQDSLTIVEYLEDHLLGQRQIYASGPRAGELVDLCASRWPGLNAADALAAAESASLPADKVATQAPLPALLTGSSELAPRILALLTARLADAEGVVRRAALTVCARLPEPSATALLRSVLGDPQLGEAARVELAARATVPATAQALHELAEAALAAGDAAQTLPLLDRLLVEEPLASSAYLLRAQAGARAGQTWTAFFDVTMALAVARRQGVWLQAMQELQTELRQRLLQAPAAPQIADELHAVAGLATLLRLARGHEVEEIATTLLALPGRAALWWLAIGLARRARGRLARACEALEQALASVDCLPGARFLLGECRRELGDLEGALAEYAQLDWKSKERRPPPSLLSAYADELIGLQAPWEAREHVFLRVGLLREHGRAAEALAVLTPLLAQEPQAADALLAQGILLGELGRATEALLALDRAAAALRPEERLLTDEDPLAIVQRHRAAALTALGQTEAAAVAAQAARRLSSALSSEAAPDTAAGYAALRRIAQRGLVQDEPAAPTAPADAVASRALRSQVAALLVAALAALDDDTSEAGRRELLRRASRGFVALGKLAPTLLATSAASLRAILGATAAALGVADADLLFTLG